ncbi:MAG: hypothetical protein ABEK17_00760 [Candidatus Aenigmatarchaeota archaeon]
MELKKSFLSTLKNKKNFKELENLKTSQYMKETSFFTKSKKGMVYKLDPFVRVEEKIKNLFFNEVRKESYERLELTTLQDKKLWERSGRWGTFGDGMYKIDDREIILSTTEEPIASIFGKRSNISYKELPILVAGNRRLFRKQIQIPW